jgi:hypothetical protein
VARPGTAYRGANQPFPPLGVEGATSIGAPRTVSFTVATPLGDARRSAGVWMGGSSGNCAVAPLPRLAGVTLARDWLWGVNTPCQRVKWARGLGPRAIQPHLALLGELDLAEERAGRLRRDGVVGRAAAATDRPATTVEQADTRAVLRAQRDHALLCPV